MKTRHAIPAALLLVLTGCQESCRQPFDHTEQESLSVALTGLGPDCAGEGQEEGEGFLSTWAYSVDSGGQDCRIRVDFFGPMFAPGPTIQAEIDEQVAQSGERVGDVGLVFQRAAFTGRALRLEQGGSIVAVPARSAELWLEHEQVGELLVAEGEALASASDAQMTGISLADEPESGYLAAVFQDLHERDDALYVDGGIDFLVPLSALAALSGQDLVVTLDYAWTVEGEARIYLLEQEE